MRIIAVLFLFLSICSSAQVEVKKSRPVHTEKVVKLPSDFGVIDSLGAVKISTTRRFKKHREVPNKLTRYAYTNTDAKPVKEDEVRQFGHFRSSSLTPLKSWSGMNETSQGVSPPDPSGAIGLNHYVQMVNTAMQIFDRDGNSLWGPSDLSSVFPGAANDGDPIVLYDQYADRWFISQFQNTGNKMLIAISQTSNPLGSWYYYDYSFVQFPDYPKFSIWGDGYYMTANMTAQNAICFERDKMLQGDPSARMVALTFPNLEDNGFFSALPAHASGDVLPEGPIDFFYFQDDGWASGSDRIKIWEMNVDWDLPENSSLSVKQELTVAPFNTDFDVDWKDLSQPGTSQKLDAVPGAFMYMGHYREFKDYNAITLCHTVDVDLSSNIQSAIRWYELREKNGVWELHQQSTYAPDSDSRWMGSMAIDRQGNIGMAYSVTSTSTFPSIRFTGRKEVDALGLMTISESSAFNGTGVQTSTERFGDYAHMTLDPIDGLTFWYTGEYIGNSGWETGIFSFKVGEEFFDDIAVIDLINPQSGVLTAGESITVLLKNLGQNNVSNFPIAFNLDGNPFSEIYSKTLNAGDTAYYTFSTRGDFSLAGAHNLNIYTSLLNDGDNANDTLFRSISTAYSLDASVTQIISPKSGVGLSSETVEIKVKNMGGSPITNIPVAYDLGLGPVLDTIKTTLAFDESIIFTFSQKADLSNIQTYEMQAYTQLVGDQKSLNDTAKVSVENKNCDPIADCSFTDMITSFQLSDLNNISECSSNGYGDYTDLSATVTVGEDYNLKITNMEDDHNLSIWIDFNDNLTFEEEELVFKDSIYSQSGEFNFNLPEDSKLGTHIMRVRTAWEESSADPCLEFEYGETEDYKIVLLGPNSVTDLSDFNIQIIPSGDGVRVYSNTVVPSNSSLELMNGVGQVVSSKQFTSGQKLDAHFSVSNFANGIYYVKISNDQSKTVKQFVVR